MRPAGKPKTCCSVRRSSLSKPTSSQHFRSCSIIHCRRPTSYAGCSRPKHPGRDELQRSRTALAARHAASFFPRIESLPAITACRLALSLTKLRRNLCAAICLTLCRRCFSAAWLSTASITTEAWAVGCCAMPCCALSTLPTIPACSPCWFTRCTTRPGNSISHAASCNLRCNR